jgi:hypothetical protein
VTAEVRRILEDPSRSDEEKSAIIDRELFERSDPVTKATFPKGVKKAKDSAGVRVLRNAPAEDSKLRVRKHSDRFLKEYEVVD